MDGEATMGTHQLMDKIESAKTVADLVMLYNLGELRVNKDDELVIVCFIRKCEQVCGKHWSEIITRGMR